MAPRTYYAKSRGQGRSADVSIAYQVVGEGPIDLVLVPGWVSHIEAMWEEPANARLLGRLASFSRLILFDKRGTGLSDRVAIDDLPSLEVRMDDVRAVMDAAGSESAALFGTSEGGPMCALFAATHPERTRALVMYGTYAKRVWDPEYPWAPTPEQRRRDYEQVEREWGGPAQINTLAPSAVGDARLVEWWGRYLRMAASPGAAIALLKMNTQIDIRGILPSIHVPTLLLHRTGDLDIDVRGSRYMAGLIPDCKFVELPGSDHLWFVGDSGRLVAEIEEVLTGVRPVAEPDRQLMTLVFTDIVGSTRTAADLGDRRWRDLLQSHHQVIRRSLESYRGREVDTAGDGFFAAFDGPARAVKCAQEIQTALAEAGITTRVGVHTGECEVDGTAVRGLAVHIAARVMAAAPANETYVSSTVRDLVHGAGLEFEDRGQHELKGIPGKWNLYAAPTRH